MATAVATSTAKVRAGVPGRKYDHVFFSTMAVLLLGSVFLGFARSYYLAGMFHAPLPSAIIHVHGALFSSWILFLLAQTTLVVSGRTDIHRRIGIAGFLLACLMVVVGVWAATNSLGRSSGSSGHRSKNVLYHSDYGYADFFGASIFCVPGAVRFRGAQTHYYCRDGCVDDCGDRALADCSGTQ